MKVSEGEMWRFGVVREMVGWLGDIMVGERGGVEVREHVVNGVLEMMEMQYKD
jgi:hypothetical protein